MMSTKVDDWNISYKKGNIIFRRSLHYKIQFDMSDLPLHPAERYLEVEQRLLALKDPHEPSQQYFRNASFGWIGRLASAVIKEMDDDTI